MHRRIVVSTPVGIVRWLRLVTVLALLPVTTLHAQFFWNMPSTNLATWANLDGVVSNDFSGLTGDVTLLPPGLWHTLFGQGYFTFSPGGNLATLTNLCPCNMQFGVPVWSFSVIETQTTPHAWLYIGTNGVAFRTNICPSSYSPTQWVQTAYGHAAPSYLVGSNVDLWYADRDRSRFGLSFMLVNSNDWPTLQAAQHAAATNAPPPAGVWVPRIPSNTNDLGFVGVQCSPNVVNLLLYSPSNRLVSILTCSALTSQTNSWTVLGHFNAVSPFNYWQTTSQPNTAFFRAGYSDVDSDHDGIPDFMEIYVYGTNPYSADSDNDNISDYNELFIYGTDPNNPDTTIPSATFTSPPNNYQLMWVP